MTSNAYKHKIQSFNTKYGKCICLLLRFVGCSFVLMFFTFVIEFFCQEHDCIGPVGLARQDHISNHRGRHLLPKN